MNKLSLKQWEKRYDRKTGIAMTAYNRSGGGVKRPVKNVSGASPALRYRRANFIHRKTSQILSQKQPLQVREGKYKGYPTPAAMQLYVRWDTARPRTYSDVRKLKQYASRQKEIYKK